MSQTPPEKIRNMDWRINNVTWTTAPLTIPGTSTVISAGAAVSEQGGIDAFLWAPYKIGDALKTLDKCLKTMGGQHKPFPPLHEN
jgi:hypothetical protein